MTEPLSNARPGGSAGVLSGPSGGGTGGGHGLPSLKETFRFVEEMRGEAPVVFPLELKILGVLLLIFLFLLFLILVLWDAYGKQIGALYAPNRTRSHSNVDKSTGLARDRERTSSEDYLLYQKLPTFFYEYSRKKKKV